MYCSGPLSHRAGCGPRHRLVKPVEKRQSHGLPSNEVALRILSDRRPAWLDELVELVCEKKIRVNRDGP